MMTISEHLGCMLCGLDQGCESPRMRPDTRGVPLGGCDVLLVGEAPGSTEDAQGIPFVGRSGSLLRDVVVATKLDEWNVVYTNIVHCRPPDNKTPTRKQIEQCLPLLWQEIKLYKPTLIILLGNTPLKAVLGESGITNWRGTLVQRDDVAYLPVFHPAYILRNDNMLDQWVADFDLAVDYLSGGIDASSIADEYDIHIVDTRADIVRMAETLLAAGTVSWDTECNGLRYGDLMVLMSFATFDEAWAVPVGVADDILRELLASETLAKIGHNVKFDMMAVHGNWDGLEVGNVVGDSMLLSYLLDPVPGRHGLKHLAGRHIGMYDYDKRFADYRALHPEADPVQSGDLRLMPLEVLGEYGALDAIATINVHGHLLPQLNDKEAALYHELLMRANVAITRMQAAGVMVDKHVARRYTAIYDMAREQMLGEVCNDKHVRAYTRWRQKDQEAFEFNPGSTHQMWHVLFGVVTCPECDKIVSWAQRPGDLINMKCVKCDIAFRGDVGDSERRLFYGLQPRVFTPTLRPSVKWDNIKMNEPVVPLLGPYRLYKLYDKMVGTYLYPAWTRWPDSDGRVRGDVMLHGTETGRLRCRDPNLFNIPTPEKEPGTLCATLPIKNVFTHSWPGGCLMSVDQSGMELRTMASVANCAEMKRIFGEGLDLHSMVTEFLYETVQASYAPDDWKAMRYRAKWVNWTLLFGGDEHTLYRLYGLEKRESTRLVLRYYELFPEVLDYREWVVDFAHTHGYVESPLGRRRPLPYINDNNKGQRRKAERSAINMPIQSAASDIVLCALIIIDETLRQQGFKSALVNTVYDSVMLDVHPDEVDDVAWLCKEIMENVVTKYGPSWFPGLDFSWFTVPLMADIEVGTHYGAMQHYQMEDTR